MNKKSSKSQVKNMRKQLGKVSGKMGDNNYIAVMMLVATLFIALSFVISRTLIGDVLFTNKVISKKNLAKDTLEQNLAEVEPLRENYNRLIEDGITVANVLTALPISSDYSGNAAQIEAMASLAGVQLTAVTAGGGVAIPATPEAAEITPTPSQQPTPQEFSFRITATGSFKSIQNFLKNIETSLRPFKVTQISISGSEPALSLEMGMATFYQAATVIGEEKETLSEN